MIGILEVPVYNMHKSFDLMHVLAPFQDIFLTNVFIWACKCLLVYLSCAGQVTETVDSLGLANNTMMYFTSDHGGHIEDPQRGGWNGVYKGEASEWNSFDKGEASEWYGICMFVGYKVLLCFLSVFRGEHQSRRD